MCGIIGIVSTSSAADRLLEGLQRLEYRGYDSTGVATITGESFERRRAEGKLANLQRLIQQSPIKGTTGIGHTRWATHGAPTENNAHPHISDQVALVHNGIIENYLEIKKNLLHKGHQFDSDTDSEVVTHLITDYLNQGCDPLVAVEKSLQQLRGAFALAILFAHHPNQMIVARRGSPLAIGFGQHEMCVGSDAIALAPWTQDICFLEEGDYALITTNTAKIYDENGHLQERPIKKITLSQEALNKGPYSHYMLKEISEQPIVLANALMQLENYEGPDLPWAAIERLTLVGCGTAFYAAMVAKYWFEKWAGLPVDIDIASEFRYRDPLLNQKNAYLFISQSGETLDTLAAFQLVKDQRCRTAAVVNVPESSLARLVDQAFYIYAGPEIGVASTKAFTSQLLVLGHMALRAAQARGCKTSDLASTLRQLPDLAKRVLALDSIIQTLVPRLASAPNIFYLGRGPLYPIALEGALKLKEISYIHAEGFPAGELKHGPIALIEPNVPVVVLCPSNPWFSKTASNIQEILARGGYVICLTDPEGEKTLAPLLQNQGNVLTLPILDHPLMTPILYTLPLQLLAFYVALSKGANVDQPRNLAKSVTVE